MVFGGITVKSLLTGLVMASRNQDITEEDLVFRGRSDFTHGYIAAGGDDASSAHFPGTAQDCSNPDASSKQLVALTKSFLRNGLSSRPAAWNPGNSTKS